MANGNDTDVLAPASLAGPWTAAKRKLVECIRDLSLASSHDDQSAAMVRAVEVMQSFIADGFIPITDVADRLQEAAEAYDMIQNDEDQDYVQGLFRYLARKTGPLAEKEIVASASPIFTPVKREKNASFDWREGMFSAAELQQKKFTPIKFIVPGIMPEGVTLLASKPKVGKSWLALDLALAVAGDRFTLGTIKPAQGDVLGLFLEDSERRLRSRMDKLMSGSGASWPARLTLKTNWRRLDQGGLDDIERWCDSVSKPTLVIPDTIARVRPLQNGKGAIYAEDVAALAGLQKLAGERGFAVLGLHHLRKQEADDPFDTVSGSLGLTGVADTILVMKRQAGNVVLHVTGRDVETAELALLLNKTTCRWSILGAAAEIQPSRDRARVIAALTESATPLSPKEIMIAAELKSRPATDMLLFKMKRAGEIERLERGHYTIPGKIGKIVRKGPQTLTRQGFESNLSDLSTSVGAE